MSGQTVSHCRILNKLGGGMGVVFRTEDIKLHRHVAIKVVHNEFVHDRNGCYPPTVK